MEERFIAWTREVAERHKTEWSVHVSDLRRIETTSNFPRSIESDAAAIAGFARRQCTSNFGFALVRGIPTATFLSAATRPFLQLIASSLGAPQTQDRFGDQVGILSASRRGPDWYNPLPFHTDGADLLLLLAIHPAASGGLTRLACSEAILSSVKAEMPEDWPLLFDNWVFHRSNRPGPAYFERPIFATMSDSSVTCFFLPGTIRDTPRIAGTTLTDTQLSLIAKFEEIAERPSMHLDLALQAGDLLVVNNTKLLHARTSYEDNPKHPPRMLYRMWVDLK